MFVFILPQDAPPSLAERFEAACAPYSGMVYRHCLQMLHHREEAEDAAQEAMLRAFRAFEKHRGDRVASWLYTIAHNVCLDVLKSARMRKETASLNDENAPDVPDGASTPEQQHFAKQEKQALWRLIQTLPQNQQVLLQLYYGEGLDYEQLAQATGVSLGTVKSRLNRAKQQLRTLLADEVSK